MSEGSWVGLDVHAQSVVAGVIDAGSGEVRSLGCRRVLRRQLRGCRRCRRRFGSCMRLARLAIGSRVGVPGPGSTVSLRRRRGSGRQLIGLRPTGGTLSGWRGCFGSARSVQYGSRRWRRRRRVILFVRAKTRVAI
jgi:hypothetical protein